MNTYEIKREIVNFSKKVSKGLTKPKVRFVTDMVFQKPKVACYPKYQTKQNKLKNSDFDDFLDRLDKKIKYFIY